ncbi:MAG: AmmeMemoRadiSam system protein B [Phycisphaerae bacterium]|nr:AmmeMemoRadiSam system protein B [Phycisphaerae bacterium]MDD5380547.1 AmmeMemoRadiSam system protein B [Phycisphaerae bacterium]
MQTRKPVVAGQFYPGDRDSCIAEISECLQEKPPVKSLPETIVAGIVPHAGWTFSGSLAAMVFSAIKQRCDKVDTFIIFGAAHGYYGPSPAVYDSGRWLTPLGEAAVDEELADAVLETDAAVSDASAHLDEHSIEVQVPFIQHLFAGTKILPILTPPNKQSISLGGFVGDIIKLQKKKIICIGSTDLTHYGPRYGFAPMGTGTKALHWASDVNDKEFVDFALQLQPQKMLASAAENFNACGPGAAAAAVAVAKKLGRTKGVLLAHTNSNKVMLEKMAVASADSVGYAAIVF